MLTLTPQNITYILRKYEYKYNIKKENADETIICALKQCNYPYTNKPVQISFACSNHKLKQINDYNFNNYANQIISQTNLSLNKANLYLTNSAYDNNLIYQDSTTTSLGQLNYVKDITNPVELINILGFYHDFYHDLTNQLHKLNL